MAPSTSQNSSVRDIHFNMLRLLFRVVHYYYKNNASPVTGKFNTKIYILFGYEVILAFIAE